jgi:hypothetical protein
MSAPLDAEISWRTERAQRQGFDRETAEEIASARLIVGETRAEDVGIDLHELDRLLAKGCRRELALEIVR